MQKINDVLKHSGISPGMATQQALVKAGKGGAGSSTSTPKLADHERSLVELVHQKMIARYGAKWADAYPGDAKARELVKIEWGMALAQFTLVQVRGALELCRTRHPSWPPTCDEFAVLCNAVPRPRVPALPPPRAPAPPGIFDRLRAVIADARHPEKA